jgi:hypothetical protein
LKKLALRNILGYYSRIYLWAAILPVAVEHTHHSSRADTHGEEPGHSDIEPLITKRMAVHEKLAQEINKSGIDCEALLYGSQQLEGKEAYYSHSFALSSRLVTNKGMIRVSGKNIDFIQILQRN